MKKIIFLIAALLYASSVLAQDCAYKLISPSYTLAKNFSKNVFRKDIDVYMKNIDNPLVASVVHLSKNASSEQEVLAKKTIMESYKKYQLSAEILYKDIGFFDFSNPSQVSKSIEIRKSIKEIWSFTNFEVAKFQIDNPSSQSSEMLQKTKTIISENILTESGEGLFYLALYEKKYGNKIVSDGGFIASAEVGFERSYPFVISAYKEQGKACKEYHDVFNLIYSPKE